MRHNVRLTYDCNYTRYTFRIITLNVRGLSNEKKRRAIFDKYRKITDLLVLQETHSTSEIEKLWENEWGGKALFSHGTNSARGIGIFMSKENFSKMKSIQRDEAGRLLLCDLHHNDMILSIIALYAPNEDNPGFFQRLRDMLEERSEHKIIIGDFNLVLNVEKDRENTYCNNNNAKTQVENIMDQFCLQESWRTRNEDKREFSWIKKKQFPIKASRIDFALTSTGLDQKIGLIMYMVGIFTDHRALYICFELDPFERGKGYWKFNCSLLQNREFLDKMNIVLDEICSSQEHDTAIDRWEHLKFKVKETSTKFAKEQKAEQTLIISQLSEIVTEYESRLPLSKEENSMLEKTRIELEEATMDRIKGVMFRSKVKWYEEGEKNTRYFYALEKIRYNSKTCYKLVNEDGNILSSQDEILQEQRKFYTELYSEDKDVNFNLKNTYNVFVSETQKQLQKQQINMNDLQIAIKLMKNNKTPGEDGIPVDFYKVFWGKIKMIFYQMVLEVYENDCLHDTARKGVLNLIPKPNKDARYIKNLRPITLLNTDYKIIEKSIANKILPSLKEIIHRDQRGFMKNRRVSVNIRKMLDIIQIAEKDDLEAVVLSLDFVKCFDKCSFSILHGSLEFFDFGEVVKLWTKILYKDFTVKIQNNGHFSEMIEIRKGVHQGGCCSSVYFLIIAEILALALRSNQDIDGIIWREIKNLLNQFADDMDIFSLCNEKSLKNIHKELEDFRTHSGFTVSYEKTTMYRIGSLRHSNAQMYSMDEFVWSNEDINVLGVKIAHENVVDKNYNGIVDKARETLKSWTNRGLSLFGKVQVVNTLVASLFVYKMMVLPRIPANIVKNVENEIRNFIWNGKKSKIALNNLQLPKEEGGLNLVHLKRKDIALKATWPQILASEPEYETLVYKLMRVTSLGQNIWRCSLQPADVKKLKISNSFWSDVLESWSEFNYYKEVKEENQIIWYNSSIQIRGKPILWKDALERGLLYVHQLFTGMCFKPDEQVFDEFGLTKLRYNSLKVAIPKTWKSYFMTNPKEVYMPLPPHNYDYCFSMYERGFAKRVYRYISDDAIILHNKFMKWKTEIGDNIFPTLCDYVKRIVDIKRVTNIPKYRSFQYRLLHRAIITNVQLKKWKIVENDICNFCKQETETIKHLMWDCETVKSLWEEVFNFIEKEFNLPHVLIKDFGAIIINQIVEKRDHIANFICLLTKYYIYSYRCLKKELSFVTLKAMVNNTKNVEKYIALKNNKITIHHRKWSGGPGNVSNVINDVDIREYVMQYVGNL